LARKHYHDDQGSDIHWRKPNGVRAVRVDLLALLDDGVLKATSAGLLFGMLGFMVTLLIARMLADLSQ
jgi:hypothetical protein